MKDPEDMKKPEEKPKPPMQDTSDGPQGEPKPETGSPEPGPETGGEDGGTKAVIELLTQVVERLQSLESSLGLYKAKPEEEKMPDEVKEEEKCNTPAKKADMPTPDEQSTITKANLDRITKAEERLTTLEQNYEKLVKSIAKPPDVLVIDPEAIKKAEKSTAFGNVGKITRLIG